MTTCSLCGGAEDVRTFAEIAKDDETVASALRAEVPAALASATPAICSACQEEAMIGHRDRHCAPRSAGGPWVRGDCPDPTHVEMLRRIYGD